MNPKYMRRQVKPGPEVEGNRGSRWKSSCNQTCPRKQDKQKAGLQDVSGFFKLVLTDGEQEFQGFRGVGAQVVGEEA